MFRAAFADPVHAAGLIRAAMALDPGYAAMVPHIAWDRLRRVVATVVDAADRQFETDPMFETPLIAPYGTEVQVVFTAIFEQRSHLDRLTAWQGG